MSKLQLPNITLIAVAGNKQAETIASMYKSMARVDFGACVLVTNIDIQASGINVINVGGLGSWQEYNRFIVKELYKYFSTEYCLICQWDSWVLDANCWLDDYFDYDILGAPGLYTDGRNNYNGGVSLRSRRFQEVIAKDKIIDITAPEDEILCRLYRYYLEKTYHFKYPNDDIASKFAFELHPPLQPTFAFHAFHHEPYKETIVIKRSGALGDCVMLEPLLHYYHIKGYKVVLDTHPEFYKIYFQHYFPVYPRYSLPKEAKFTEINLDMSYEINPKQAVLQSYYDIAGIRDGEIRNARLNIAAGDGQKLFNKYAVIHIDSTGMPYRDIHGIEWSGVVKYLESNGYTVFQIGRRVEQEMATYLNTMNIEFMMFVLKGADLFIGGDSGPAQVAVGLGVPSIIFFGSVNPEYRYPDMTNIRVVQSPCCKEETKNCYHNKVDVVGDDCIYSQQYPPCTQYTSTQVIDKIKDLWHITQKQIKSERY